MKTAKATAAAKERVLEALTKSLGIVTNACKAANVSRSEFYTWKIDDKDFLAAVDDVEDIAIDFAETSLHDQIREGNPTSTIFYLKTKGKKRGYVERTEVESNVTLTGNPVIEFGDTSRKEDNNTEEDNV